MNDSSVSASNSTQSSADRLTVYKVMFFAVAVTFDVFSQLFNEYPLRKAAHLEWCRTLVVLGDNAFCGHCRASGRIFYFNTSMLLHGRWQWFVWENYGHKRMHHSYRTMKTNLIFCHALFR